MRDSLNDFPVDAARQHHMVVQLKEPRGRQIRHRARLPRGTLRRDVQDTAVEIPEEIEMGEVASRADD